eukprot:334593_1
MTSNSITANCGFDGSSCGGMGSSLMLNVCRLDAPCRLWRRFWGITAFAANLVVCGMGGLNACRSDPPCRLLRRNNTFLSEVVDTADDTNLVMVWCFFKKFGNGVLISLYLVGTGSSLLSVVDKLYSMIGAKCPLGVSERFSECLSLIVLYVSVSV